MADLIVYFSRNYENYVSGAIRNLDVGNTEVAACIIQQLTGADLFKLEPIQEYSRNYNECIAEAQADQRRNARPELRSYPENLDGYDTVYLGFPNYWGTMPMAVFTFLEHFEEEAEAKELSIYTRKDAFGNWTEAVQQQNNMVDWSHPDSSVKVNRIISYY